MKKLKYFCSALLVACLLAIPAAAQKGERNNNVSKLKGKDRAEHVQAANKKGDRDPSPSKGRKNKGQHEGSTEKKGKAKAKGHSK